MARFKRAGGVLLHPTALPGSYGIGTFGAQALAFIDWLADAGQSYWQICPLVPTGFGDSPYQGFSAFAGNPNLIDLERLVGMKLLTYSDLEPLTLLSEDRVDFSALIPMKERILKNAWLNFSTESDSTHKLKYLTQDIAKFRTDSECWIEDYALFMVIKEKYGGRPWDEWEEKLRLRDESALQNLRQMSVEDLNYHVFVQYLFHKQWTEIKKVANSKGISIIGDLPIFIAFDSSDCWARPDLFQLDEKCIPKRIAGVPPDYFSETGQLWGNPLYDWEAMEKNGFAWWIEVLQNKLEQYDVLRIDHFRGFSAYWSVPFGELTAVNGEWVPAPGDRLFAKIKEVLGDIPIIAEDLGVITEDVAELIERCGFPGMKVLQFAFDSAEENDYLPHTYHKNCLVYTGTHDNDTVAGWYENAPLQDRITAGKYLNLPDRAKGSDAAAAMIRTSIASVADLAISPLQDILGLGSEARFNTPGTLGGGNWTWRVSESVLTSEIAGRLRELYQIYGRSK